MSPKASQPRNAALLLHIFVLRPSVTSGGGGQELDYYFFLMNPEGLDQPGRERAGGCRRHSWQGSFAHFLFFSFCPARRLRVR